MKFERVVVNSTFKAKRSTVSNAKYFLNNQNSNDSTASEGKKAMEQIGKYLQMAKGGHEFNKGLIALNSIFEEMIPSKVTADLTSLLSVYAQVTTLKRTDVATISIWESQRQGTIAKGAGGTAKPKRVKTKRFVPVTRETYTGMGMMDYRDLANDPSGEYNSLLGEVVIDIRNQLVVDAQNALRDGLEDNVGTTGNVYFEASGITQARLDDAIAEVGTGASGVSIMGDYRVIKQITPFVGIDSRASDAALREAEVLGYVTNYNGAQVFRTDNFYNYNENEILSGTVKVYKKMLSKADLFVIGRGDMINPNRVFLYGAPTTLTGTDVESGGYAFRVDQESSNYFIKERASNVAVVSDTALQ